MNEEHERLKSRYYVQREALSTHPATCPCQKCATHWRFEESLVIQGIIPEADMRFGMIDSRWSSTSDTESDRMEALSNETRTRNIDV
jgi:hypothetical protein